MDPLARHSDPSTSHDAARSLSTTHLEDLVFDAVRDSGSVGVTLDDLVQITNLEKVTVSPRLAPLERKGLVFRQGKRPGHSSRQQTIWTTAA